jgi:hypothetical protein
MCAHRIAHSREVFFVMYSERQTAHLNELHLLRNYASGQLRQELDDEIEGLRHQTGSFQKAGELWKGSASKKTPPTLAKI